MNIPGNPLVIGWEGYFTSVVFFPKTHNSSLIMSKATDEATVGAVLQGAGLCPSRASRLTVKKKGKTEKVSETRGDREDMPTQCTRCPPRLDPRTESPGFS